MAEQHFRMDLANSQQARDLYPALMTLDEMFDKIKRHFDAMTQQKDSNNGDATDFVTMAGIYKFQDEQGTLSSEDALAAYDELNSLIGNSGPAIKQCAARFR